MGAPTSTAFFNCVEKVTKKSFVDLVPLKALAGPAAVTVHRSAVRNFAGGVFITTLAGTLTKLSPGMPPTPGTLTAGRLNEDRKISKVFPQTPMTEAELMSPPYT
jgi:hypothetical protein